jgi:hypothetical protein
MGTAKEYSDGLIARSAQRTLSEALAPASISLQPLLRIMTRFWSGAAPR